MDTPGSSRLNPAPVWFNPADYFTFVLDQEIRRAGMPGGYCGFVLELATPPNLDALQDRLDLLVERFPQASARLERRGKRYAWIPTGRRIPLERLACPPESNTEEHAEGLIVAIFNRPVSPDDELPLRVHWVARGAGGYLLLNWTHPLFDARGGKILLDFLNSDRPEAFRESPSLLLEKLGQQSLWRKLRWLIKAKRHNDAANRLDSCLPTESEEGAQVLRLAVRRYSAEETQAITRLAQSHMGVAGRTLYLIGGLLRAMERAGPPAAKAGYCVPYAFNLRRPNAPTPVFGNHVGCLFARATREQVRDRAELLSHLLAQYRETIAEELDYAYLPLMWLGQWLSPARYARLLRKQRSGGELSSVWFSDLGELRWGSQGFLGTRVVGMFHLCWMTLPPGLALLAGQCDGRLTLSYSYLHPAVDEDWLRQVVANMDAELLENSE